MKPALRRILFTATASMAALGLLAANAAGAPPPIVPVQGFLTDLDGNPLEGSHRLRLELYRVAVGGTAVYGESHADVAVEDGAFVVYMGSAAQALDLATFAGDGELWLQVTVDDTEVIEPRFRLGTVPYAASAAHCEDAASFGGRAPSDYVTVDDAVAWSDISGVPASLADGDGDTLAGLSCSAGSVVVRTASGWECRVLDAADLQGGVLNTSRFSAYADLMNEGRIDANTGETLQTRSASDARYYTRSAADARYLQLGQAVTTHTATSAGTQSVQATNKTFCALSGVELTHDDGEPNNPLTRSCSIQRSGSTFTLTASAAANWDVTCVMFCL